MCDSNDMPVDRRQSADADMCERVCKAIDELVRSGITPSFYAVADLACVARSTLYRKPHLRRLVEEARSHATHLQPSWRAALSRLENENEALKEKVRLLEKAQTAALPESERASFASGTVRYEYAAYTLEAEGLAA